MRSALLVTLLIYCLPVLIGQSPQDLAKDLRSTDWKVRNSAALALEKLPSAHLPVDDLVQILNAKDLSTGVPKIERLGGAGVVDAGREPSANPVRVKPVLLSWWLGNTRKSSIRIDVSSPPSKHPLLLAPFSSSALSAYLLRRSSKPMVFDVLASHLSSTDPCLSLQCALSLANLDDEGVLCLERALASGVAPDSVFEALLHTKGIESRVSSILSELPARSRASIEDLLPPGNPVIATAIGRHEFGSKDASIAKQGIILLLHYDADAVAFAHEQLRSDNEEVVKRGLSLVYALGARASDLRDDVRELVKSESLTIAQWAMSCLANMDLQGASLELAVGAIASHLDPRGNEDIRYVAIRELENVSKLPSETLDVLARLAADGTDWDREAALRALSKHDALDRIGPMLEVNLGKQFKDNSGVFWLVLRLEHLPELVVIEHYKRNRPEIGYIIARQLRELPPSRLQNLARRVTPWFDNAGTRLKRVIQLIDLVARYESGIGLPEGFLDPDTHSFYELRTRMALIVESRSLLLKDVPQLFKALSACRNIDSYGSFCSAYESDPDYMAAVVRALPEHALLREVARQRTNLFRSVKLEAKLTDNLIASGDPVISEIGRRLAMVRDPFDGSVTPYVLQELRSPDSRFWAIRTLKEAPRPPVISSALISAVQELVTDSEYGDVALLLLLQWSL